MRENREHFTALVNAWSADLYRFAYWLCRDRTRAEDLVQETFLRAWRSLTGLRDEQAAKSWLLTILRREHFRRGPEDLPTVDIETIVEEPTRRHDSTQDWVVRRQLLAMPEEYREPLVMQVLGGFNCDEIATELGISKAAVMTRLFRARQKLRATLNGEPATEWPEVKDHELP